MTPLEVLKAARAKIEKPENWTQNIYATDGKKEVVPWEPEAKCFCSIGALQAAYRGNYGGGYSRAYETLHDTMAQDFGMGVAAFNDSHTHEEVLAAFDRAIASLEAQ